MSTILEWLGEDLKSENLSNADIYRLLYIAKKFVHRFDKKNTETKNNIIPFDPNNLDDDSEDWEEFLEFLEDLDITNLIHKSVAITAEYLIGNIDNFSLLLYKNELKERGEEYCRLKHQNPDKNDDDVFFTDQKLSFHYTFFSTFGAKVLESNADEIMKEVLPKVNHKKIIGSVVGTAVGDALGSPLEGKTRSQIKAQYKGQIRRYINGNLKGINCSPGKITDDTFQTISIIKSLIKTNGVNIDDICNRFAEMYKEQKRAFKCSGTAFKEVSSRLSAGVSLKKIWKNYTPIIGAATDCGAAIRSSGIGLFYSHDIDALIDATDKISRITHNTYAAVASALIISLGVAYLYNNKPGIDSHAEKLEMIDFLQTHINNYFDKCEKEELFSFTSKKESIARLNKKLNQIKKFLAKGNNNNKILCYEICNTENFKEAIDGINAASLSLYDFLRTPNNFNHAVISSINSGGDTDSYGAMTGALSGAYNGIDAIHETWLYDIPRRRTFGLEQANEENMRLGLEEIVDVAETLFEKMPPGSET